MFKLYVKWMHVHTHVSVCMHVREGGTEEGGERGDTEMETEHTQKMTYESRTQEVPGG